MRSAAGTQVRPGVLAEASAMLLLAAAMLFGGGPRGTGDLVVHLVAVPALLIAIVRWRQVHATRVQRLFLAWLIAAIALVALQLLPLPASWFARLPQRASVLADLHAAGLDPAWLPMTLDRWGSVRALLAIATFGAMWMLATTLPAPARLRLLGVVLGVAALLALFGFAQAAAGTHAVRFYPYHHGTGAIGSFANRNHFASLLAMLVPIALAFGARAQQQRRPGIAAALYGLTLVLLLAVALTFSRAGLALALAALAVAMVVLFAARPGRARWLVPTAITLVGALAVAVYAASGLALRLEQDPLEDLRWQYLRIGIGVARDYLPWGSGMGSFPWVYAPAEPVASMVAVFAERAHNDVLQVLIEAGWPGIVLLFAFLAGLLAAAARIIPMGRAGRVREHGVTVISAVAACIPLLHSLVDYPLRTLGVAVVFALLLACVCGAEPDRSRVTEGA